MVPAEHKKLIKHIVRIDKKLKKKKIEKRTQNRLSKKFLEEEILQEAKKNKSKTSRKKFTRDEIDSEDNDEDSDIPKGPQQRSKGSNGQTVQVEDTNNLLLKFDTEKERFHFAEHPVVKAKEKLKKQEETKIFNDVIFKDGKIIVQEEVKRIVYFFRFELKNDVSRLREDFKYYLFYRKKII